MATGTLPFVCIPAAAIWRPGISSHAKALFSALLAYMNRRTRMCNPKLATLAARLEKSIATIKRALAELRRAGMVICYRSLWGNRYEIATPDRWQAPNSEAAGPNSSSSSVSPAEGSPVIPHSAHGRSHKEPDVLEPEERHDAADAVISTPLQAAAAAATAVGCTEPQHPAPQHPAPLAIAEAEQLVAELMPQHPEPGNFPGAVAEAVKILAQAEDIPATVETMREAHAACRVDWATYPPGRFIPRLPRWLRDGDWKFVRAERKGVQSETWLERRARESREYDETLYRGLAEQGMWNALREYGGDEAVELWREKIKNEAA